MSLKEKFQELDKLKACAVTLLALTFVSTTVVAYQITQVKNILSGGADVSAQAPKSAPSSGKQSKKPSDYKFGTAYEKALKDKKPMALLFYADWCGYCIRFMPIYEKLYKQYKNKYNFVKINVEDSKYSDEVKKYEIQGFPTLFLVNPKDDEHIHVENRNFGDDSTMKEIFDNFYNENK